MNIIKVKVKGINETRQAPVSVIQYPHFYVHIEPKDYKGDFGFDYLKSEYIKVEKNVLHSDGNERKGSFCETIPELEAIYNPTRFYENQQAYELYYSPWIALLPNNTEYKLKLKKTVLNGNFPQKVQIEFRCANPNIEINGSKLNNTQNPVRIEYKDDVEFKIRCVGEISDNNLAIELYAILPSNKYPNIQPFHVGQMFIQPNNVINSKNILFVHAIFSKSCQNALSRKYDTAGNKSLQRIFNEESFNQALFSCPIIGYESFDMRTLSGGANFIAKYALDDKIKKRDSSGNSENLTPGQPKQDLRDVTTNTIDGTNYNDFRRELFNLFTTSNIYQTYGNQINNHTLKLVILIDIAVLTCANTPQERHLNSGSYTTGEATLNGGYALIQCESLSKGFSFNYTIIHEIGHLLGLQHPWERTPRFRQGYTNSYMDYDHNGQHKTNYYKAPLVFMKSDWVALKDGTVQ